MSVSPIAALPLILLTAASLPAGQSFLRDVAETNVNQRYTIESISVDGVHVEEAKLPGHLRRRMAALIGEHCDAAELEELATALRKELHLREVTQRLSRGSHPDSVRVNFEVVRKDADFDISVPRFLYHSEQGFTGEVDAGAQVRQNNFSFSVLSNGDDLTERFTGIAARYEDADLGTDRLRFGVVFEDYHEMWNDATRVAAENAPGFDLYRTRRDIAPHLTFVVAKALTVSAGASFEQMDPENPSNGLRAANAFTSDAHYGSKIEGDAIEQTVDATYSLRAGTRGLGSDYSYARHVVTLRYELKSGKQMASEEIMGGTITGNAPSFERFVLGTSSTLRGWDRYTIDPLGGTRVVHNSLTYGYRLGRGTAQVFYDCGALWDADRSAEFRHSLGAGYRQGVFFLTMALPVVEGRIAPVFMTGMNY
ncbi:MAG: BamA/TamA family outer membrane protein [Bryobacteraceae bacterium]